MKEIKEEIKNITLYETPETNEALKLLTKARTRYNAYIFLAVIACLALILSLFAFFYGYKECIIISFVSFILLMVFIIIYKNLINPYIKLFTIAENNDKIRHEERIRYKERKRLEENEIVFESSYKDTQKETTIVDTSNYINTHKNPTIDDIEKTLDNLNNEKIKLPPKPNKN